MTIFSFDFDEESANRIVRAVKKVERRELVNRNQGPGQSLDYPVPMFIGKLTSTISGSCDGTATLWGTTSSTGAEATLNTTEAVRDWFGAGGSTGDKVMLFRQYGTGRLYYASAAPRIIRAVCNSCCAYNSTGTATVWRGGSATTETVSFRHDWHGGAEAISSSKKMRLIWEGEYFSPLSADCEDE